MTELADGPHLRVARSPLGTTTEEPFSLYFNVTVFGEQLHLGLRPNQRLVVPGAMVEWQEDFQELFRQPLHQDCVYTGNVTGMPGATVAISNCDGLVRDTPLAPFCTCPQSQLTQLPSWLPQGMWRSVTQVRGFAVFHRGNCVPLQATRSMLYQA